MKVILLQDVPKIGKKFEVKEIPSGHARNLLIPKGLAKEATASALAELKRTKEYTRVEQEVQDSLLDKYLKQIEDLTLTIVGKASDQGHLFASLHANALAEALEKDHRIIIDPSYIVLDKPIKITGVSKVPIRVKDKEVLLTVEVQPE